MYMYVLYIVWSTAIYCTTIRQEAKNVITTGFQIVQEGAMYIRERKKWEMKNYA